MTENFGEYSLASEQVKETQQLVDEVDQLMERSRENMEWWKRQKEKILHDNDSSHESESGDDLKEIDGSISEAEQGLKTLEGIKAELIKLGEKAERRHKRRKEFLENYHSDIKN